MLSRRLLRIKAVKALYSHFKSESDSLIVSEKNLMLSIDKTYELYHQMLWLVVEVANYAENRIELGRRKHLPTPEELNPNTKFVDNRVVAALRESDALTDYLQRKKLGWVQAPELVKKLYHAMVESDYYRKYMDAPARSFKEDVKLVESFYARTVGESRRWRSTGGAVDPVGRRCRFRRDHGVAHAGRHAGRPDRCALASSTRARTTPLSSRSCSQDAGGLRRYIGYIDKYTSNWDVRRIAHGQSDHGGRDGGVVISSIPVKVTLDEYIEDSQVLQYARQRLHQWRVGQNRRGADRRGQFGSPDAACSSSSGWHRSCSPADIPQKSYGRMRKSILFLIAVVCAVGCVDRASRSDGTREAVASRTILLADSVSRDTVDLGRMRQGEIVRQRLLLENGYREPMVILSVSTSCGCTSAGFDRHPVQPGALSDFSFEFDSKGFAGDQIKHITLRTSASPKPFTIVVTGYVAQ
ncbi:MAG: DUF1573 domain-containing protein [Alistipes sp.]